MSDGVGSWNKYGISASAFSNELINNCSKAIEEAIEDKKELYNNNKKIHKRSSS